MEGVGKLNTAWTSAQALYRSGQCDAAWGAYQALLAEWPRLAGGWADLGGLLAAMGRRDEALEACQQALALEPGNPCAWANLGRIHLDGGFLEEAEKAFRGLLAQHPDHLEGTLMLAQCLTRQQALGEALQCLQPLLARDPACLPAFTQAIHIHGLRADWKAAAAQVEARLMAVPGCPEAELEQAFLDLLHGRMPVGWDRYESRRRVTSQIVSACGPFTQPLWDGSPFPGRTLLLHWEQGFGDTVMFIRYAAKAKALGGKVVAVVQPSLVDLVATCPGVDLAVAHGLALPEFDLQLPLPSLPRVFQSDLDTLPGEVPYLDVPSVVHHREGILEALGASEGRTRIGYAWSSRSAFLGNAQRSLPMAALEPLGRLSGVAWYCFQVPAPEAIPFPSVIMSPLLGTFSDTAYALSGMDLVVTSDTVLAHVAGALGVPTLVLLSATPDWRWMLGREDSPWYPTMRLYRQPCPGDWDSVIQSVLQDLEG